ncbi:MAG: hypothetical protein JWP87_5174 [Labilithrix sp.]|nr:hypothetical protein [Labilithrix sp.]
MIDRLLFASSALVVALAGAASACGGGGSGEAATSDTAKVCAAAPTTQASALASPPASFDADVAPTLVKSCTFSPCHGSRGAGNHGVFLGAKSAEDMAAVKAALLAPSHSLPSMPYVTPGDPEHSFLLHKLDNSLCGLDEQCVGGSCGKSMPDGNDLLPDASRDAIRRWIAQGAK